MECLCLSGLSQMDFSFPIIVYNLFSDINNDDDD
jgi:hypothetical protein